MGTATNGSIPGAAIMNRVNKRKPAIPSAHTLSPSSGCHSNMANSCLGGDGKTQLACELQHTSIVNDLIVSYVDVINGGNT